MQIFFGWKHKGQSEVSSFEIVHIGSMPKQKGKGGKKSGKATRSTSNSPNKAAGHQETKKNETTALPEDPVLKLKVKKNKCPCFFICAVLFFYFFIFFIYFGIAIFRRKSFNTLKKSFLQKHKNSENKIRIK